MLELGNVDAVRDWGHARDYCAAYYKMMQLGKSSCYVVSTGQSASVRDFCTYCFHLAGYSQLKWTDAGLFSGQRQIVRINKSLFRDAEIPFL